MNTQRPNDNASEPRLPRADEASLLFERGRLYELSDTPAPSSLDGAVGRVAEPVREIPLAAADELAGTVLYDCRSCIDPGERSRQLKAELAGMSVSCAFSVVDAKQCRDGQGKLVEAIRSNQVTRVAIAHLGRLQHDYPRNRVLIEALHDTGVPLFGIRERRLFDLRNRPAWEFAFLLFSPTREEIVARTCAAAQPKR